MNAQNKFDIEKFSKVIDKNSVTIDVGAHVGIFTKIFAECSKQVIAFEPNNYIFDVLQENIKNSNYGNIKTHKLACMTENKKYVFNFTDPKVYKEGSNGGFLNCIENRQFAEIHSYEQEVDGVNLYEFLKNNYSDIMDEIKFIKIDSEGYDKEILKTLVPIINKNKPVLMVEAFRFLNNEQINDYFNVINSLNYKIYDISPLDNISDCTGPLSKEEFQYYIYNVCDNGNFLCVHQDDIKKFNLPDTIPNKTCVIVFGRNDGYKEKERFLIHITKMLETFDEVIYIDWNSEKRSFLYEIIDELPKTNRLKHFVIEPKIAKILTNYDDNAQVCNTVLSFNIGLRRTDAEYIVLSTTDIIPPSRATMNNFIKTTNKTTLYTLSRRDINYSDVIGNKNNLDDYRDFLDKTVPPRYFPAKVTPNDNYSIFNCCGDFQLATKNIWLKMRGYEENMPYACFVDTNAQKKAVLYGFELKPIYDVPFYHMSHTGMENDGSSPSKKIYNDPMEWVEYFDKYIKYDHKLISRNDDTWGFSETEIEYELI